MTMEDVQHITQFRIRYSETDQMQTYHHSRVLEWFGCARTELLRALGHPYREMEAQGFLLPVIEAHVEYLGKAQYDDKLKMGVRMSMSGRARFRFDVQIEHADTGKPVCRGWTVHAVVDTSGKPVRPPGWMVELA